MNSAPTNDENGKITLGDILATDELGRRASRPANFRVEAQVMAILAQTLADRPQDILQVLVRTAVELCGGGTCGISLLEPNGEDAVFRWVALAGVCEKYAGGCTPRNHSPCGVTLDRGAPQLFIKPGRYFTYLADVEPAIAEGLVIPFFHGDVAFGTIWIVSHDPTRRFDGEDTRLMTRLGAFTAAGLQTVRSLKSADKARQDLTFLADLRKRIALAGSQTETAQTAIAAIGDYFLADRCCIIQADEAKRRITVQHDWRGNESNEFHGSHSMDAFGGTRFWHTAAIGSVAVRDVRENPETNEHPETWQQLEIVSLASTPCARNFTPDHLLWLGTRRAREWTAEELSLLEATAVHI